jgi:NADH pyrophosphatase NudC (nudix superfamily)
MTTEDSQCRFLTAFQTGQLERVFRFNARSFGEISSDIDCMDAEELDECRFCPKCGMDVENDDGSLLFDCRYHPVVLHAECALEHHVIEKSIHCLACSNRIAPDHLSGIDAGPETQGEF